LLRLRRFDCHDYAATTIFRLAAFLRRHFAIDYFDAAAITYLLLSLALYAPFADDAAIRYFHAV